MDTTSGGPVDGSQPRKRSFGSGSRGAQPGLLLALPISYGLSWVLGMQFIGSPLNYQFSAEGALAWLGGALLLSTFASYLPAQNAARLTVREVLAYE